MNSDASTPGPVGSPVERPVRPCAWKCSTCANTSDCEGATRGDNWCNSCGACETMRPLYDQAAFDALLAMLKRCRPIIEADAQMMADISRHAPLDADSQAKHDATEYESEKLARELERLLGPNAELTR